MDSNFGILCLDNDWKITSVSPVAAKLLCGDNTGPAKLEGIFLGEIIPAVNVDNPPSREALASALAAKGNVSVADFTCRPENENYMFCISAATAAASSERDIADLYRQNKKLTAIAIFAGGIAHDYNNALTAVLGNISLAKFEAEQNRELLDLLNDAEKASMKIKILTERLSAYSRGIKPARTRVRLASLVEEICAQKRRDFAGSIIVAGGDSRVEIEGDSQLLYMTFECVIENAIEAVDPWKGKINLGISEVDVVLDEVFREMTLVPGRYIKLAVSDDGSGIAADKVTDIFNPYFTTKDGHDGIGLALAYSILKRHRGFVSVNSVPGQGSTFLLYIPLF